jgi:hypothetical protein
MIVTHRSAPPMAQTDSLGNYFLLRDRLWISRIRLEAFGEPRSGFGRTVLPGVFAVKPDGYAQVNRYLEWIDSACLFEGGFNFVKAGVAPAQELNANVIKFGLGVESRTKFFERAEDLASALLEAKLPSRMLLMASNSFHKNYRRTMMRRVFRGI